MFRACISAASYFNTQSLHSPFFLSQLLSFILFLTLPTNLSTRLLHPLHPPSQRWLYLYVHLRYLPFLHLHLPPRHRRRSLRRTRLRPPPCRSEMDYGVLLRFDGHVSVRLRDRQLPSLQHRPVAHGIFLPIHVQRRAVRLDPRGFSGIYSRDGQRSGEFHREAVQYRGAVGGADAVAGRCARRRDSVAGFCACVVFGSGRGVGSNDCVDFLAEWEDAGEGSAVRERTQREGRRGRQERPGWEREEKDRRH